MTLRAAESGQEFILPSLPRRGEGATLWQSRGEEERGPCFGVH
jgi:hypothetical protein